MNTLRAIVIGCICLVCGLLVGYQAHNSKQNGRRISMKVSSSGSSQDAAFQMSASHVRQQYRHLQPVERSAISMHTIVPTGCDRWQDFQMAGLYWSFLR